MSNNLEGKRIVILGAARQGCALVRFLVQKNAHVILTDQKTEAELVAVRASLEGLPVEWVLGDHPLELLDKADIICPSGGVPLTIPFLQEAARRGIPFSNDTQFFLEESPCKVIGITGSAGKTTTTTLVGKIAEAAQKHNNSPIFDKQVWVGGNIGNPLLANLPEMKPDDLVILELSSFQLEQVTRSPQVAAVLNITPNHLDRHASMEDYTAAKARILKFQSADNFAVLGRDDLGSWNLVKLVHGILFSFGLSPLPQGKHGTFLAEENIMLTNGENPQPVLPVSEIQVRGQHNLLNVLAACAIASCVELPIESIAQGIREFRGVPHRIEFVREWGGARWYNDSIATAPERSIAAIRSFDEPLVLLAGGRDKKLPWDEFARVVSERVDHLILFGEAAELIQASLKNNQVAPKTVDICPNLKEAVQIAVQRVKNGDVVLLSPGGTSFDEFRDFEERGERFRLWVNMLS
jgi:UDP-N-acetylmuramoylalanine--D-glutamate ligase